MKMTVKSGEWQDGFLGLLNATSGVDVDAALIREEFRPFLQPALDALGLFEPETAARLLVFGLAELTCAFADQLDSRGLEGQAILEEVRLLARQVYGGVSEAGGPVA